MAKLPAQRYATLAVPALLVPAEGGETDRLARKRAEVAAAQAAIPCSAVEWFVGDHDIHAQHPVELAAALHRHAAEGIFA